MVTFSGAKNAILHNEPRNPQSDMTTCFSNGNSSSHDSSRSSISDVEHLEEDQSCLSVDEEYFQDSESSTFSEINLPERTAEDLRKELAGIRMEFNIANAALTKIAKLFRKHTGLNIPTDARAICKTDVEKVGCKNFLYFGMEKSITRKVLWMGNGAALPSILSIHVFVDGLKLYNSSSKVFWPIVCSVLNIDDCEPFVVGCYCGDSKPPSLENFLREFITEYVSCKEDGILIRDKLYKLQIKAIIADAQARSFIKRIKGHGGYSGCERCYSRGVYLDHAMLFTDFDAQLRTDDCFREGIDDEHRLSFTPLTDIDDLDMIFDIPYDYMHLVCLGACKRLLSQVWVGKDAKRPHRFSTTQKRIFNEGILSCAETAPAEFKRKGRIHSELHHWKAVEFRTFLLYTGPIILKPILSAEKYEQFLFLHVGIRILCSKKLTRELIDFADQCLRFSVYK